MTTYETGTKLNVSRGDVSFRASVHTRQYPNPTWLKLLVAGVEMDIRPDEWTLRTIRPSVQEQVSALPAGTVFASPGITEVRIRTIGGFRATRESSTGLYITADLPLSHLSRTNDHITVLWSGEEK